MAIFAATKALVSAAPQPRRRGAGEEGTTSPPALPRPLCAAAIARRSLVAALLALAGGAGAEAGLSLVMLERHDCPWCRRWHREIGPIWPQTDLGRRAPLRRVDIGAGPLPADLAFLRGARFTPTFVLVENGVERGRIIGYQGDLFFWQAAEALFAGLPAAATTPDRMERQR